LLVAVLIVAASAVAAAADAPRDSLSVGECVALARLHAPEVEARNSEARAAGYDSTAARFNGRPNYSIFGGVIAYPEGAYDPALTNLGEYGVRLGLELPLMDGGARKRERAQAALQAVGAAAARDLASRDAGLRAAAVALGALHQHELEYARRESLAWLDQLAELVQSGVRAGAHGRADEVRVLLERDAQRSDLVSVIESRDALLRELAQLIGRESGPALLVSESDAATERAPSEADSLALFAGIESAPEIRAVRSLEASERLAVEEAQHRAPRGSRRGRRVWG
jgi:outer membrane protein TolC